jgi:hypothetical protein
MSDINPLLTQRPTNNPYRYGAVAIWSRLKWDLNLESWRSRKRLKAYKDKYAGDKAVIVCNGPSLLKSDLSLLEGVFTFGLNKIYLLFDKSNFRPSCIVAMDNFVIEQSADFYNQTDIPLYLIHWGARLIKKSDNVTFIHDSPQFKFSQDCSMSIYHGHTVTFFAMQLAFHMGFTNVALIGCDHNFATKGPASKTVISGEKDNNHFDPNYNSGGVKWQLPNLLQSEISYTLARDMYEAQGRSIVNATEGGNLEIFPRTQLSEFINI